jgi:hypothetical protein
VNALRRLPGGTPGEIMVDEGLACLEAWLRIRNDQHGDEQVAAQLAKARAGLVRACLHYVAESAAGGERNPGLVHEQIVAWFNDQRAAGTTLAKTA